MDITEILNAISTVGFPIVVSGVLIWINYQQQLTHKEETSKLSEAINKLEIVMAKILTRLGGDDDE